MRPLPLHLLHAQRGARFGEIRGHEVVMGFGPLAVEYRAAREDLVVVDHSGRGLTRLTGVDRVSFLHGQTTNEVNQLPPGGGNLAALLTNRGKMTAQVRVLRRPDDILVESEVGFGAAVLEHLQRGCISEEVELEDWTQSWSQVGLYGPRVAAWAQAALGLQELAEHAHQPLQLADAELVAVGSRFGGHPGVDLLVPTHQLPPVWEALLASSQPPTPMGEDAYELVRIELGEPRFGVDMGEETNPLEANLQHAISYQKGCYVGQEVIAKATFRGHVARKLTGLKVEGEPPPPGTELQAGGKVVGRVTSARRYPDGRVLGLGFVKHDLAAHPGTALMAGSSNAITAGLPFAGEP